MESMEQPWKGFLVTAALCVASIVPLQIRYIRAKQRLSDVERGELENVESGDLFGSQRLLSLVQLVLSLSWVGIALAMKARGTDKLTLVGLSPFVLLVCMIGAVPLSQLLGINHIGLHGSAREVFFWSRLVFTSALIGFIFAFFGLLMSFPP